MNGFESLISKEWIYLCGTGNSLPKPPDIMTFTLFLDIVWQLMIQNEYAFEFTTVYLIRLYDLQTIPWNKETQEFSTVKDQFVPKPTISPANNTDIDANSVSDLVTALEKGSKMSASYESNRADDTLSNLNMNQLMFLYNSYYREMAIEFSCDLLRLQLWRPLYLRWLTISDFEQYYNKFPHLELIQYQYLLKKLRSKLCRSDTTDCQDNEEIVSESYL